MFKYMRRKFQQMRISRPQEVPQSEYRKIEDETISTHYTQNLDRIKHIFSKASDVVIREFEIETFEKTKAFIVYIDGLVDREIIQTHMMKTLMLDIHMAKDDVKFSRKTAFAMIKQRILSVSELKEVENLQVAIDSILSGDTVLFLDGSSKAMIVSVRGWEARSIDEPDTEVVVRGPREGFTENIRVSTSQLRRRIKNSNLKFESMKIGTQTKTDIVIAYVQGIADENIVNEVKDRLSRIDTDSILESGYIEEFIEDAPFSPLPTIGNSEKPDVVAAKILEGRVAIMTDGTPFVLTVPYLFVEAFQSSEDYYSRPLYIFIIRWLRILSYILSVFAPALYVAITTFHQEMLPPSLLISVAAAREGTPFPAIVEAIGMGIIFEILKEAGVRLPRPVGQAVSIVGALVIGESAVSAGLIGAPMVIVVALTAISSFVVPSINDATSIMRLLYVILSGFLGLFGIVIGVAVFLTHMVSLRSFGVPYLSPLGPINIEDLKDVLARSPWWAMFKRPSHIGRINPVRQKPHLMPGPSFDEKEDDK